jgi:FKBP-type peptidyl-prolyl cis-trans isomerase
VLEVIGWFMGKNSQAETFDFTKDQLDAVSRGFTTAAAGKEAPTDLQKIGPQVEQFVKARQDAYLGKLKKQGLADAEKFFADVKKKPGVVVLPDGLVYEITKPGTGPNVKVTDTVVAHYTGTLINGNVFDTSLQPRQPGSPVEPAEFPLDQVIPGWTEGLQKINKGGKIKLYIPPQLAYGDEGRPGIPPSSALIFDIEVIDVKPTPGPASLGAPAAPGVK